MSHKLVRIKEEISIEGFHFICYFEHGPNFFHLPEKHNFWEMLYVDYGAINSIADGVGCSLSAGQVVFHSPNESHCHIANQRDASNVVMVGFSCNSPIMSFFDKKVFTLSKASKKILSLFIVEAENSFGKFSRDYDNNAGLDFANASPGASQLMQCYLIEFLFSLIRSGGDEFHALRPTQDSRALVESSFLSTILQYIQLHVTDTPSLSALCEQFSISRTHLCNIFKEGFSKSPVNYWIEAKIRLAKKLLREGNMNITQISEYLGYSSIHHFTRMFKRATGLSPTAYKKSINADTDH